MANDKAIIRRYGQIADRIIAKDAIFSKLSDDELKAKAFEFKEKVANGEDVSDFLVDIFATVREASWRLIQLKAFKVQIIGALILNDGDIAEMKTGEGKTLTGLFSAYINALSGNGVHIVTVNEYLSQRDFEINGRVLTFLGLTVGLIQRDMNKDEKRKAYACDITYTTNSELGFDYLRDNMVFSKTDKVQRGFNYAIIDEADSVLIDEARTPLIISGGKQSRANLYIGADKFAKTLNDEDIEFDLETKQVFPTDNGIEKAHIFFNLENLFDIKNTEIYHLIMNALKANFIFKKEVEYTVQEEKIVLIDQFTGRVMPGRSYSDGLHQALQAKEGLEIEEETITLAVITYQNFYRLYAKLSGMTGTAKTEEEEFLKIYNTRIVVCPTNKPIIRKDKPDYCFYGKNAKLKKLANDIKKIHETGRPILIGTTSVESSEQVSHYLDKEKLKYETINAKNHYREAEIVEKAGSKGAITLATNMAGRGTDIKLTEETKKLGGLIVVGVERNESRRIDNQLRGRAGRQGDPGSSVFYISMEDDLMVRFTSIKTRNMFQKLEDDFIQSKIFTRSLTNAQKKLEGLNFDQRKNVLDYDNILAQHRENIYMQRDSILDVSDFSDLFSRFSYTIAYEYIIKCSDEFKGVKTINPEKYIDLINNEFLKDESLKLLSKEILGLDNNQTAEIVQLKMSKQFEINNTGINKEALTEIQRRIILQSLDKYWTRHINLSQKIRTGIYLQQYAQNNPLNQYIEESSILFKKMKIDIAEEVVKKLLTSNFTASNSPSPQSIVSTQIQGAVEKPKQINLSVDEVLNELGLRRDQFSRPLVLEAFKKYKEVHKNDELKLKDIEQREKAMIGLMDKLDDQITNNQKLIEKETGYDSNAINELLKYFELGQKDFFRDKVIIAIDKKLKTVKASKNKKEITIANKNAKSLQDLIYKLDLIAAKEREKNQKQRLNINLSQDQIISLKKFYNLENIEKMTLKDFQAHTQKFIVNNKGKLDMRKVNLDFALLAGILCVEDIVKQNKLNNKNNQQVIMKDKDGKILKSVKLNKDGSLSDDDMNDTEKIETRIKIG